MTGYQAKNQNGDHLTFPADRQTYQKVFTIGELKNLLRKQFNQTFKGNGDRFFYYFQHGANGDKKIYARCRLCSNQIYWRMKNLDEYQLFTWNNYHTHRDNEFQQKQVCAYLLKIPQDLTLRQIKKQVMKNHKCSPSRFYCIMRKFEQSYPNHFPNLRKPQISKQQRIIAYLKQNHPNQDPLHLRDLIMEKFGCSMMHYYSISRKYVNMKYGDKINELRPRKDLQLLNYLRRLPQRQDILNPRHMQYAKQELDISQVYYHDLVKKFKDCLKAQSLGYVEEVLNKKYIYNKFCFSSFEQNKNVSEQQMRILSIYPDILFITSDSMKKYYDQFGGIIKIQTTLDMIKIMTNSANNKKGIQINKKFRIMYITGKNYYNQTVVFAMAIISFINPQIFAKIFQIFFDKMQQKQNKQAKVVITEQQDLYSKGLESLQMDIKHLWDINSVLNKLKNVSAGTFDKCVRLAQANSIQQYNKIYLQLKDSIKCDHRQLKEIQKFNKAAQKCCVSHIDQIFIGLHLNNKVDELQSMRTRSKEVVKSSGVYAHCVIPLLKLCQSINQSSHTMCVSKSLLYQTHLITDDKQLNRCKKQLCEGVFDKILSNLMRSLRLNVIFSSSNVFLVEDHQHCYSVTKNEDRWCCQCNYYSKILIPCSHQLKVCQSYWQQVGDYWKKTPIPYSIAHIEQSYQQDHQQINERSESSQELFNAQTIKDFRLY